MEVTWMSINRGMDKDMQYTYTMKYYSAIKKSKIMPFTATGMNLEIIKLNEVRHRKTISYRITHMWNLKFKKKKRYKWTYLQNRQILQTSLWFSSVAQSCPTLWDPMNRSTPGLLVHHQLPEFTQTHVHWVGDAIQPSQRGNVVGVGVINQELGINTYTHYYIDDR